MPLFKCDKCEAVENTALSNYWHRPSEDSPKLCSDCDPKIGKWHGAFEKRSASRGDYLVGSDGFLYHKAQLESGQLDWRQQHQGFKIIGPA